MVKRITIFTSQLGYAASPHFGYWKPGQHLLDEPAVSEIQKKTQHDVKSC
jgi:hypothetical protein